MLLIPYAIPKHIGIWFQIFFHRPKSDDFFRLINVLKTRNTDVEDAIGAYGDAEYHIGPDERLFTEQLQVLLPPVLKSGVECWFKTQNKKLFVL